MATSDDDLNKNPSYLLGYTEGTLRHIGEVCSRPGATKKEMATNLAEIAILCRAALTKTTGAQ